MYTNFNCVTIGMTNLICFHGSVAYIEKTRKVKSVDGVVKISLNK